MKEFSKTMYVIVDKKGNALQNTLSYLRKDAISEFLDGSTMTWNECKKYGWKCLKVDVIITSASNFEDWN